LSDNFCQIQLCVLVKLLSALMILVFVLGTLQCKHVSGDPLVFSPFVIDNLSVAVTKTTLSCQICHLTWEESRESRQKSPEKKMN